MSDYGAESYDGYGPIYMRRQTQPSQEFAIQFTHDVYRKEFEHLTTSTISREPMA